MAATMSPHAASPLRKKRDVAYAELQRAQEASGELESQRRALQNKREQLGATLAREGKLTREQRSELANVNRQIKGLSTPLKRATAREQREREKYDRAVLRVQQQENAVRDRDHQRRSAKANRRIAQIEAKSRKQANYARLPEGSKPSKAISDGDRAPYGAMLVKQGRGEKARWSLVVTDSHELVTVPLEVSNPKAVRPAFLPGEALKAIEKAGAFRITPSGAIQPLQVTASSRTVGYEDVYLMERTFSAEKVGQPVFTTIDPKQVRFPAWEKLIPKAPAKANSFQVRLDPRVLQRAADALGAKQGVTLTFDLSKCGKASKGRRCEQAILVGSNGQPEGVVMPVRIEA